MNKAYRRLGFIVLVVFGLVISGCLSLSDSPTETRPTRAISNSSAPKAGSSAAKAGGGAVSAKDSSAAKTGAPGQLGAKGQKTWSKAVGFLKGNWLSLLIILIICTVSTNVCLKVKKKVKPVLKRNVIIAAVIMASLGLIYGVLHYGIMRNDGNFQHFGKGSSFVRAEIKKIEGKTTYARVYVNRLNFRSGPSASHKIIRGLTRNTRVEVINASGEWWKVKYENTEGYVNSKYLQKE